MADRITSAAELQTALHELIPISVAMGVEVVGYDGKSLQLTAPLANNINHQQSAFGGSLFSLCAMASWGLLQLKLGELGIDANTVVAGGDVSYSLPVFETLDCRCELPADYPGFEQKLLEQGKASLIMSPTIVINGADAMSFSGKFVVKRTTI